MTPRRARALPFLLCLAVGVTAAPAYADDQPSPGPATSTPSTAPASPTSTPTPTSTDSPTQAPSQTSSQSPSIAPAAPAPPTVALAATGPVRLDRTTTLTATVRDAEGQALADRQLTLQRLDAATWRDLTTVPTSSEGAATTAARPTGTSTRFRAVLAADGDQAAVASDPVDVAAYRSATRLTLTAPASVVDEHSARFTVTMRTTDDASPVPARVSVQRRVGTGGWVPLRTLALSGGSASLVLTPRVTATYRAVGTAGTWWTGSLSASRVVRNVAPGTVVHLPAGAPHPRAMAAQPRATRTGAAIRVSRLTDAQWSRMRGVSWHRGCPVGRAGLRNVELNYWAFDGYRRRGRLVVNAHAVGRYAAAFSRLYAAKVPLRRVYPTETFGYSSRSHGANDYLAMRSDNTSAFNCRWVTGRPHVMSPHSTGYAVDINTFENPYLTRGGWLPNSWWPARSFGLIAWRTQSATVVALMRRSGFRWTYGTKDSQHFDVRR